MHVSIRMDPGFVWRRAGAGFSGDFLRSERGIVTLEHIKKSAVAQSFLPPGLKAEGLTIVFAGDERGARLFVRRPDRRMDVILFGRATEGVPSRFALSRGGTGVAITRKAVESLLRSPDPQTREGVAQLLAWVDGV